MDKEELRKRMSKAIGTFENQMVRRISEDCAEIAIQYFTEQLHKPVVMQGLPKLSQPDRDELLDEILKVFYKQGFEIIPPKKVDFSKFIGKSLFRKQGSPSVGKAGGDASVSDGK